ncbi:class I SAM-dependent methyltransferase [Actinocrispum sp. NPDC049592]|uniref:class I SAM-dependent methyltransferase n=1 Tax=Actinocrispum sp. NPDC049592 TaxID=3154835 RepID=UPI003440D17D
MLDLLANPYHAAFACPTCHGPLSGEPLFCETCERTYLADKGYLDFAPEVRMKPGLGPFFLQDPLHVTRYEEQTRVAFLNIMGANWNDSLTPEREDDYLSAHIVPVDGPVLDLGCGAGRWTRTVVDTVGQARVIGLDLSLAMIDLIRAELPELCVVRANALQLPFGRDSLGAVNCSNALQLFPEPRTVIQEVGRVLKPGGTFTAFTFRQAERPTYRYFQSQHEKTFNVRSFRVDELTTWLTSAGLDLLDLTSLSGTLLFTARKKPS